MAASMRLAQQSVASTRAAMRPSRQTVVVRAQSSQAETTSRRALLGMIASAVTVAAATVVPQQASAMKMPWQESIGGMVSGGGSSPKSPTRASMEGYTLEGTRKSGVSPKKRAKLLAKARKEAQEAAAKS